LHHELAGIGVTLLLAGVHGPVEDLLERSGVLQALGEDALYTSAVDAVVAFDEREAGSLGAEDHDALVVRMAELAQLATRHSDELSDETTSKLADVAAQIETIIGRRRPD